MERWCGSSFPFPPPAAKRMRISASPNWLRESRANCRVSFRTSMQYVLPFILAMVVAMATLPLLVRLANKWLIVDQPGERKVHVIPVPRVGGLAMACGVLVAALLTIPLQGAEIWFLVAAGILIAFGV